MKYKLCIRIMGFALLFIITSFYYGSLWLVIPFLAGHELTHCFFALKLGYKVKGIYLLPFGLKASLVDEFIKPWDDIAISLSGPLFNLIFFIIFSIPVFPQNIDLYVMKNINMILFIFNLIPAGFLDGGRILKSLAKIYLSIYSSYFITDLSGFVFGGIISLTVTAVQFSYKSVILLGLGVYFIYTSYISQKEIRINIIKDALYKQVYICKTDRIVLKLRAYSRESKLFDIIKEFNFECYHVIYMIDSGILGKKLNEMEIIDSYYKYGNITIKECLDK